MSTIQTTNIKNAASVSNNIVLDGSGNAAFAGTATMSSSFLRNRLINGDCRIDQRNAGASLTVNSGSDFYAVDRFYASGEAADGVFTFQRSTVVPAGFTNSIVATVTTADASIGATQRYFISQRVEGFNVADFNLGTASAVTFTLSFWVRSSVTGTFGGSLSNGTSRYYPYSYTISAANTWEYKTVTVAGDTTGTWNTGNTVGLDVLFSLGCGSSRKGTAGAWSGSVFLAPTSSVDLIATNGAIFYLTGVQLEVGSVATPFERRLYGQEFMLCQRYFQQVGAGWTGMEENATQFSMTTPFWVTMRAAPTSSLISTSILTRIPAISTDRTITGCSIAAIDSSTYATWVFFNCSGGNVSGRFIQNRNGGNILNASAEL